MKMRFCALAVMSALLAFLPPVYAASSSNPREACRDDAQSFCRGIQPGGGRIKDCLEDHYKEISDSCYAALKNAPPPPGADSSPNDSSGPPPNDNGEEQPEPQR